MVQFGVVLACSVGLLWISSHQVPSFLAGGALSAINFALLAWLWKRILDKKPVATSSIIIVTKYAILGGLLYVFVRKWNLQIIPLLVGLSTLVASLLIVALNKKLRIEADKRANGF